MGHLEIIARLKELGPISDDRKQKIELEEVGHLAGDHNLVENAVKIYVCDSKTAEILDSALKKYKKPKGQIIEDWVIAYKNIAEIASGEKGNWWVLKPQQYLNPSTKSNIFPLDDKHGEFSHYNKICETLEKLLAGETPEYTCHFRDAPDEIKELLDKAKLE